MEKYTKELSYISRQFVDEIWTDQIVTKTATFAELSRTIKSQSKLQWKIMEVMESSTMDEDNKTRINSAALCDLTYKYIREMLIINEDFTEQDKVEFMNDNGAVMQFGLYALNEKIAPFFSKLMSN